MERREALPLPQGCLLYDVAIHVHNVDFAQVHFTQLCFDFFGVHDLVGSPRGILHSLADPVTSSLSGQTCPTEIRLVLTILSVIEAPSF